MKGIWAVSVIASILFLGLFGGLDEAFAEFFTAVNNGDWNSKFTWQDENQKSKVPTADDDKVISNGVTVTIRTDVVNNGLIQVQDKLIISAKLTNTGIFNQATGVTKGITNIGTIVVSSTGEVQNNGRTQTEGGNTLTIEKGGKFFNNYAGGNGHFHNEGEGAIITVNGEFTNTGDVHQLNKGVFTVSSTGKLTNTGLNAIWDNRPGSTINNFKTFNNEAGAKINNKEGSTINNNQDATINNNDSKIFNSGEINNRPGGKIVNNDRATITNESTGIITNNSMQLQTGISNFGIITNSGGKIHNSDGTVPASFTNQVGGIINNELGGVINNNHEFSFFSNRGIINNKSNGIPNTVFAGFNNFATFSNFFSGTFENSGSANIGGSFRNDGGQATFNNNFGGTITISGSFFNGNQGTPIINNKLGATINVLSGGTFLSLSELNNSHKIFNSGEFECGALRSIKFNNNDGGTIENSNIFTIGGDCTLNNDGKIINKAGATINIIGVLSQKAIINNNSSGEIDNTGDIVISKSGILNNSALIFNNDDATIKIEGGTLDNKAGGDITNNLGGTISTFSGGKIKNSGVIENSHIINNDSTSIITNNDGGIITNEPGAKIDNFNLIINLGTIENCGIYIGIPPTPKSLSPCINEAVEKLGIGSNNADPKQAKAGDEVSINIETNIDFNPPLPGDVQVAGNPGTVTNITPNSFDTGYTLLGTEPDGALQFQFNLIDIDGMTLVINQDSITVGGNVIIDNTIPEFGNGAFIGGNSAVLNFNEPVNAAPGDFINFDVNSPGPPDFRNINSISGTGSSALSLNFDGLPIAPGTSGMFDIGPGILDKAGNPVMPMIGFPLGPGSKNVFLSPSSPIIPLTDDSFIENIDAISVDSPKLSLEGLTGGAGTATFPPNTITFDTGLAHITFPPGVTATGLPGDEILKVSVSTKTATGISGNIGTIVELGDPNVDILFDAPIRVVIPNKAPGSIPFFINAAGDTIEIETECPADDLAAVTALIIPGPPNECFIYVDGDLVIWTNHFTGFGAGSGGGSTSGGGGGGSPTYQGPTIGLNNKGMPMVTCGVKFGPTCFDITSKYHYEFELYEMMSGTHTISITTYCSQGVDKCNYASVGTMPKFGDINNQTWKIEFKKDHLNNWTLEKYDQGGALGEVSATAQTVGGNFVLVSFTIEFMNIDSGEKVVVIEVRDSERGVQITILNEGIEIKDAHAYPYVETVFEEPLVVEPLCIGEDVMHRHTCAFDKVKEWATNNAEETMRQILNNEYTYK